MASRQVEGLCARIADDIKATLSEAATPLAVAKASLRRLSDNAVLCHRRGALAPLFDAEQSPPHANARALSRLIAVPLQNRPPETGDPLLRGPRGKEAPFPFPQWQAGAGKVPPTPTTPVGSPRKRVFKTLR